MNGPLLGEVLGKYADVGVAARPGEPGWVAAMAAALPSKAAERYGLYEEAMIAPVEPASPDDVDACTRFAAYAAASNGAFAYAARVDAALWLLGVTDVSAFARAAVERIAELAPRRLDAPSPADLAAPWTALHAATIDLAAAYMTYQRTLPPIARALPAPDAAAVRAAALALHPLAAAAIDVARDLAFDRGVAHADEVSTRLAASVRAVAAAASSSADCVAPVAAALAPWSTAARAFASTLAGARATTLAAAATLDTDSSERWQTILLTILTAREALALLRATAAAAAPAAPLSLTASFAEARTPFAEAVARFDVLHGAIDAAARTVW